jgi:hypothetical protein
MENVESQTCSKTEGESDFSEGSWMKNGMLLAFTVVSEKLAREPGFWLMNTRQVLSI